VVGEISVRALALSITGQDPGKLVRGEAFLITQEDLNKNDIKTIQDLDAKCPVSDTASGNRAMAAQHSDAVTAR